MNGRGALPSLARAAMALPLLGALALPAAGQETDAEPARFADDAFADPAARAIFEAAHANWKSVEQSVLRYQAVIRQRMAARIRAPLKDRILYRDETAVRAFWDHQYDAVVQVLGAKSQYPGWSSARSDGDMAWLDDLAFDEPFDPGGDRLFLGGTDLEYEPGDDYWIAHPLAEGADSLYRYASGDTLTLSFHDGRRLRTVQLDVLPREADIHRISGTLSIEPESGALVRAVYRLSRQVVASMQRGPGQVGVGIQGGDENESMGYIPGILKPWTFDLSMVAIDYSLWDFEVWLPSYMRVDGLARAGIIRFPITMDVSYQMESVTTQFDMDRLEAARQAVVRPDPPAAPDLIERHFETRDEAMAFVAELLSQEGGVEYESAEEDDFARERDAYIIAPRERSLVYTSPELPPPLWEDAAGFPSDEQLGELFESLAELPAADAPGRPWALNWGWGRPGLVRYNRVEGPAAGLNFETGLGGPVTLGATAFLGLSDLEPRARFDIQRQTIRRRMKLGVYRELASANARAGNLGFGNSLNALLLGRDEGEYYQALGADLSWRPPADARQSFEVRAYAERQSALERKAGFALFHALDDDWDFRPNLAADEVDELGAEVRLSPWRGNDPFLTQIGLELYGHAARLWPAAGDPASYARASATLRAALPLVPRRWRLGFELAGGTTFGEAPIQRAWFLGGTRTLRGHAPSVLWGPTFGRGRVEVARTTDFGAWSVFTDAGWANHVGGYYSTDADGDAMDPGVPADGPATERPPTDGRLLWAVGVGGSLLDGLMRGDVSYGLNGPARQFWIAFYLDSLL